MTEDDEEVETGGVETVKLTLIADAHDDGLDAHERRECVLVRELRDQAAGAGGVRELRGVGVGEPCFFDFAVAKEGEKLEVTRFEEVVVVMGWKGEKLSSSNYLQAIFLSKQQILTMKEF